MKTAVAVLADAEARLRELVGQAAAQGDYDMAVRVATVAKDVAALAAGIDEDASILRHTNGLAATTSPGGLPAQPSISGSAPRGRAGRSGRTARSRYMPPKGAYPRFFRRGDYLVKVSWSKKERGEYQHKAARRVVELLAAAIARRAGNGRQFTSEDIFPLKDPETGGEVPSYQAYAALAWFRASGLVRPHGRQGYTAGNPGKLLEAVTAGWEKLCEAPV